MTAIFFLLLGLCLLTIGLTVAQYRRRTADQELTLDCRLQQHLLEYAPQLPRPAVREWYGGSDVQTYASGPTRK
jgi:hypothetical protein